VGQSVDDCEAAGDREKVPSRHESFFLCEATKHLDDDDFTWGVAAQQRGSEGLRHKHPPLADIEEYAERGVKMDHAGDGDELLRLLDHSRTIPRDFRLATNFGEPSGKLHEADTK
jgi:hypothetical protein